MEIYEYLVTFELGGRSERVLAGYEAAAIILVQANQINKGNRFDDVDEVTKLS